MNLSAKLCTLSLLGLLVTSCASGGAAYWIPPSSPPTPTAAPPLLALNPAPPSLTAPTEAPLPTPEPTLSLPLEVAPPVEGAPSATPSGSPSGDLLSPIERLPLTPSLTLAPAGPLTSPTVAVNTTEGTSVLYYAQAADTLQTVAIRFGVAPQEITSPDPIPETTFINPGQLLIIPRRLSNTTSSLQLIPDSEVVYSPSAVDFDTLEFARQAGGYLHSYQEWHKSTGMKSGAEIVERVAIENSVNPRLLLALLEYHSHWVYGAPQTQEERDYPMGLILPSAKGLYNQLVWTVNQLSVGYYAYREGRLTQIRFSNGALARLAPDLNAGSAALQYYFSKLYDAQGWVEALNPQSGFPALHKTMFGDPWERARRVEPLFPPGITQPQMILPFTRNWTWSFTGGPHGAWEQEGAYAALDFAPGSTSPGCVPTDAWAVAAAAGLVARTGPGLVVLDLDGDGHEQTGWVLLYLHIAEKGRVQLGQWVAQGDPIGHPSCEGGFATGTHIHIARKFNGEWVPAYGPLAFNLGGWIAHAGPRAYLGTLTRNGVTVKACTCSNAATFIIRTDDDP